MGEVYIGNIYCFMTLLANTISARETKLIKYIMLRKTLQAIAYLLSGILIKIMTFGVMEKGWIIGKPFVQLATEKGFGETWIRTNAKMMNIGGDIVASIYICMSIFLIYMVIDSLVSHYVDGLEAVYYLGIPLIGKARSIIRKTIRRGEYTEIRHFEEIKGYVGEDYDTYREAYTRIMKKGNTTLEEYKYIIELSLLATIAQEKGLLNKIEKKLLLKKVKQFIEEQ